MAEPPAACTAVAHPGRSFNRLATVAVGEVPDRGDAEKSPLSWAVVGTVTGWETTPWMILRPSYAAKKNVLSFLIGPPNVPPNWFWWKSGFGATVNVNGLALRSVLRKNSYTLPWNSLVPDLVTTLTTAPELRPYSASNELVITRNSSMLSGDGCTAGRFANRSFPSPPFTE